MNPIREHIRKAKTRRKTLNIEWWSLNNQILKLRAEIGRLELLEELRPKLISAVSAQDALSLKIKEEDDFLQQLKSKLEEVASARSILRQIESSQSPR